ncbi:MAG TPA: crosslink repair DNA glycosylase YcaQ family protein [Polyangia bacterium]|nr:crosslink repair DNA glycosylase YcaQ family protein [Polyangia bacterium]
MKTPTPEQVRYWRWTRQRVNAAHGASAGEVLAETGWMRSVGGAGPYLGLFARAGLSRAAVDAELAALAIHELPSARGCTYVVPSADYAVALRAGQGHGDAAELATAKKFLGVTDGEVDKLCRAILDALAKGPADPKDLKESLGGAVRHLGDAGKKRGMTTTLPLGLGRLQSRGEIRRVPVNGRLDQQRYQYARWSPSPLAKDRRSDDEVARELGARFFRWAAPATPAQLAWWAGLGARAARSVAAELKLVPFADGDERLMFADDRDALAACKPPKQPDVALVGSLDNLFHPRRELASMVDADDAARPMPGEKQQLSTVLDLPHHAIVDRGRLVGVWQYEVESQSIVHATFGKATPAVARAVESMAAFITRDLGDARSFSLDSPESRKPALAALRAAAR